MTLTTEPAIAKDSVIMKELVTAKELEKMSDCDKHTELIKGEIIKMSPAGFKHGEIALAIGAMLRNFVYKNKMGKVYAAETGFIIARNPDTVRAPDCAFVSNEKVAQQKRQEGFFDGAPDIAIEVVSPADTQSEVHEKAIDYLNAGTKAIWVIYPKSQTIALYRSFNNICILTANDALECQDILPGFSINVKEIF